MRVLIAEDERELANGLKYLLEKSHFSVDVVHNGQDAWDYLSQASYDAAVLDIMMPQMSGLEVLERARKEKLTTPIMMLTAKAEVADRVIGLEAGADDYLPKPFATREFLARVKALTRRSSLGYASDVLTLGQTSLDCSSYHVQHAQHSERLNNKEFLLLEFFMRNPRTVFSTERLMAAVWSFESDANIDVVWTYIGFVRKKLRAIGADIEIKTIRGAGYVLEEK